jgi:hypothetical protein
MPHIRIKLPVVKIVDGFSPMGNKRQVNAFYFLW